MAKKTAKTDEFIPCILKSLPEEQLVAAAEHAIQVNPVNRPKFPTGLSGTIGDAVRSLVDHPLAIAVLTSKYFGPAGVHLTVTFAERTAPELAKKIVAYANRWGRTANVEFKLIDASNWHDGDVRISRGRGGYWSYLGTDIRSIPRNQQTMNLQGFSLSTPESEYDRVVCHETGHCAGCPHEHMRPALVALLDSSKTIAYFERTQGWSAQEIRAQVLTPLSEDSLMGTPADQDSIMAYQLPGSITKNGKPIRGGTRINDTDAAFMAKIYPKLPGNVLLQPLEGTGGRFRYVIESDAEINITPATIGADEVPAR
jgi:hypothetical protein